MTRSPHRRRGESGGAILEFVLVFPLLILVVFVIVDLCLMLAVESLLDEAANRAVARSQTMINLDLDVRGEDASGTPARRLRLARRKIAREGVSFLDGVKTVDTSLQGSDDRSRARLLPWKFLEATSGPADPMNEGLAVLRPGECATLADEDAGVEEVHCNRETLGTSSEAPVPIQPPRFLMERHPIKIVAAARYRGYLPFFDRRRIVAKAYGYRQPVPAGPFAAWEDPQLLEEGPPPATQPPTRTPFPAPSTPEEDEFQCVVSMAKCFAESQGGDGGPRRPVNRDLDADGICDCASY